MEDLERFQFGQWDRREAHHARRPDALRERRGRRGRGKLSLQRTRDVPEVRPAPVQRDGTIDRRWRQGGRRSLRRSLLVPEQGRGDPPRPHAVRHRVMDLQHDDAAALARLRKLDAPQRGAPIESPLHHRRDRGRERGRALSLPHVPREIEVAIGHP